MQRFKSPQQAQRFLPAAAPTPRRFLAVMAVDAARRPGAAVRTQRGDRGG